MHFRKLKDEELEEAYRIHCKLVEHMLGRGIKQWLRPMDKEKFKERQERGENYALFSGGDMKVFLSLIERRDYHEWESCMPSKPTVWLNTVSVNPDNSEKGLGKVAVLEAVEFLKENNVHTLYLDCVVNDGFLVEYYSHLGFELIAETTAHYRSGTFQMALMKKRLIWQ